MSRKVIPLEEVRKTIGTMKASGLNRAAYSRQSGIPYTHLVHLERRLAKHSSESDFRKKKNGRKQKSNPFLELIPESDSKRKTFCLVQDSFKLEFSLCDLPQVLKELNNHA
jgi:hypothetical protein